MADFGIACTSDGAVVFPYGDGLFKYRYGVVSGNRSFKWPKNTDPVLFNRRDVGKSKLFLCEGETDCMALRERLGDRSDVGVVGVPGIETWNDGMAADALLSEQVWVILDNDQDYRVAGRVDAAWRKIRRSLGNRARRVLLPRHINDVCEFFEDYDLEGLKRLIVSSPAAGESRFRTLDLTKDPTPPKWLVEGMFCGGDIHTIIGNPGIGKSWITMGLAAAVAGASDTFLGHLVSHGRVLYVDEENPEDLVHNRFGRLGISHESAKQIRFLSNVGVRLDRDPTPIIDESIDYEPALIVLDSLTRFHTGEENSAGAMAALFNDGIKPLARMTGAAVVIVHHSNKLDTTSGYKRARGSGDIIASVDAAFDVRMLDEHVLLIHPFKTRRMAQSKSVFFSIVDKPNNRTELVGSSSYDGGF